MKPLDTLPLNYTHRLVIYSSTLFSQKIKIKIKNLSRGLERGSAVRTLAALVEPPEFSSQHLHGSFQPLLPTSVGPRYKDGAQTYIQVNTQISTHKQKINLKFFLKTVLEEKSYPALHPNFRAPPDVLKREKECVSYCLAPHHPASTGYILPPARTLGQLSLYCSIPLHSLNVCPLHFVSKAIHSIVVNACSQD